MKKPHLLLLILVACTTPEEGIDRTALEGGVQIPPGEVVDDSKDKATAPRDSLSDGLDLGLLSWRYQPVSGEGRLFGPQVPIGDSGDLDWFIFKPIATGSFEIVFEYGGAPEAPNPDTGLSPDTGGDDSGDDSGTDSGDDSGTDSGDTGDTGVVEVPDSLLFEVTLHDLADLDEEGDPAVIGGGSTQGSEGTFTITMEELTGGAAYAVKVNAVANDNDENAAYTLWFSGNSPDLGQVLVGGYSPFGEDFLGRGNPLGGAAVENWVLDEETRTWSGSYRMRYLRAVVKDGEESDASVTVSEGAEEIWLVAGDFQSLNQGLPAGTLFNSAPVSVELGGANAGSEDKCLSPVEAEEGELPDPFWNLISCRLEADTVVMDALAPKVIGWVLEELEPNDVSISDETYLIAEAELENAQEAPPPSGLGFVDQITGTLELTDGESEMWGSNETDVFSITPTEDIDVAMTFSWADAATDLDLVVYGPLDGEFAYVAFAATVANPETATFSEWYLPNMTAGETYYFAVLGYSGTVGPHDYTIELEWLGL